MLRLYITFTAVVIALVVRQLRRTEKELEETNEGLANVTRRHGKFIASVTHELKTPIHGVMGLAELLAEGVYGDITDRQEVAIGGIGRGAARLLAIVEDLLAYQRTASESVALREDRFWLMALADEVLEASRWASERRVLNVKFDLPDVELQTDQRLFRHFFHNLLTNAMKFSPEDGNVLVYAYTEGDEFVLCFEDDGPPISEEEQKVLFKAYWEARTPPRAFGGTGLALAVAKAQAEALKGTLTVEKLDNGVQFCLRLPRSVVGSSDISSPRV